MIFCYGNEQKTADTREGNLRTASPGANIRCIRGRPAGNAIADAVQPEIGIDVPLGEVYANIILSQKQADDLRR